MRQKQRGRPRALDLAVERKLRELISAGASSAAQVYRELRKAARSPGAKFREADVPSERTIRNYFNELVVRDTSAQWSLTDPRDRPDFLLDVLRTIFQRSERRIYSLTRDMADRIDAIKSAAPEIPPATAFLIAREYLRCEQAGQETSHLDFGLAMRPTRDEEVKPLSEPDRKPVEDRIAAHIDLHAKMWSDQPLTMWARCDWIAEAYISAAGSENRGGYMLAWDNREGVHFLQLRL
jgi:hypothetical protein